MATPNPTGLFPAVTVADWRKLVDRELKGAPFEKALVQRPLEGVTVEPLYTEVPKSLPSRDLDALPVRICMRHPAKTSAAELKDDVAQGADALWIPLEDAPKDLAIFYVLEPGALSPTVAAERVASRDRFILAIDPIAARATGVAAFSSLKDELASLPRVLAAVGARGAPLVVSTLPYHDAGADAADELACALSTGAAYLRALEPLPADDAANAISLRMAVGRDTFLELCKLRALRTCWSKLLASTGAKSRRRTLLHAVCSSRTLTVRDPWVNLLRVSTQMFAAMIGGADLVTPLAFDGARTEPSQHGHRVARNTGLVLREESGLSQVADAPGGSYAFETLTDSLAREGWKRFQQMEREGGIVSLLNSGALGEKLEARWKARAVLLARRKEPMLGVSAFANVDEQLPHHAPIAAKKASREDAQKANGAHGLPVHRDAEGFEALRARLEGKRREVMLVQLGAPAESRARVGFAKALFATVGVRAIEVSVGDALAAVPDLACLCGSDENYAEHAVQIATELRESGAVKIALAGRPGDLEAPLRAAGVSAFISVGSDVLAALDAMLGGAA